MEPPKYYSLLFRWFCKDDFLEELQGDLEEKFYENLEEKGLSYAKKTYRKEVLLMIRPSVIYQVPFKRFVNWAFVVHAFKASYRNLKKHSAYTTLNVVGFAAALSICLFSLNAIYSNQQLDQKFTDKELIYRVNTEANTFIGNQTWATSQIPLYEKIQEGIPEAEKIAIIQNSAWGFEAFLKGAKHTFQASSVNKDFFEVFDYDVLLGDPTSIFDGKTHVVITEALMDKYYDPETVIGALIGPYIIGAVIETPHKVSHLKFDILANDLKDKDSESFYSSWTVYQLQQLYIKRLPNAEESFIQAKLNTIAGEVNEELDQMENKPIFDYKLEALEDLASSDAIKNQGDLLSADGQRIVIVLMIILMGICTFNYTNLAMASAFARTKEIAVRKVMGSKKSSLVLQFLAETIILSLMAFLFGLLLFKWLAPKFATFSDFYFQTSLGFEQTSLFFLFTLLMAIFSGLIPGVIFSNTSVLQLFRKTKGKGKLSIKHLKKTMITLQMSIGLFVFIFGFILLHQSSLITNQDTPFTKENYVAIQVPTADSSNFVFRNELNRITGVNSVTTIERLPFIQAPASWAIKKEHIENHPFMSAEILMADTAIIALIEESITWFGKRPTVISRPFFLVNDLFEKELSDSILHVSQGMYSLGNEEYFPVLGTVENLYISGQVVDPEATAIWINPNTDPLSFLLELTPNSFAATLSSIQELYHEQFPNEAFQPFFLNDMLDQSLYQFKNIIKAVMFVLCAIITITIMGQIGMSMYMAKAKEKEIGVRKVLGANFKQVINLILKGTYVQLIISALIACPLAYMFYINAVPSFTIPLKIGVEDFVLGFSFFSLIVLGLITYQTWSSANRNPTESLHYE